MLNLRPSATTDPLLAPLAADSLRLPNRIAMAPMTRGRADGDGVPHELTAAYYAQRAGAGLLISEGLWPHASDRGGPGVPGIATAAQADGWRRITTAVHAAGGRIYAQLWHVGRLAHPRDLPAGLHPLAPSAFAVPDQVFTADGWTDAVVPEALTLAGIDAVVGQYVAAARNAISAGFDGIEVHGANGYLLHQFLSDNANQRLDGYGGTGRTRVVREVVAALVAAIGADRVAVRFSPGNPDNGGRSDGVLIGELADRAGVSVRALRYYEEAGLLHPRRQFERSITLVACAGRSGGPERSRAAVSRSRPLPPRQALVPVTSTRSSSCSCWTG